MLDPSRSDLDVPRFELQRGALGWEATIPFVFTNTTGAAVFLDNCNGWTGASFEQLVGDEWVFAVGVGRPDCLGQPIEVRAGGTWETDVPFFAAYPDNEVEPKLSVAQVEGRYRIVLEGVYSQRPPASFEETPGWVYGPASPYYVPKDRRVSGTFALVERK